MNAEAEVDQLIHSWDERLKRVDENLILLESEPTYQMLAGVAGQRAPLEGVTRARVAPALDALSDLFEHRVRLTEVVDRAKELRASLGFWDKDERLLEIQQLFSGPSIKLGAKTTPLSQRNLLDPTATDVAVVPEQLLAAMADAYHVARDAVAAVARAWATLEPLLETAEREVAEQRRAAQDLGDLGSVLPELSWLEAELARARAEVAKDPLGVSGSIAGDLAPRLAGVRMSIGELSAARDRVTAGLQDATTLEREIAEAHVAALRAPEVAAREVMGVSLPAPVVDSLLSGLAPWREKIASAARAGHWRSADVGLQRWFETARAYLTQDAAVRSALDSLVATRAELKGRLSARRAQLDALGARGARVDPELVDRGREAEGLLRARPTSLPLAVRVVERYEAEVVALAALARKG